MLPSTLSQSRPSAKIKLQVSFRRAAAGQNLTGFKKGHGSGQIADAATHQSGLTGAAEATAALAVMTDRFQGMEQGGVVIAMLQFPAAAKADFPQFQSAEPLQFKRGELVLVDFVLDLVGQIAADLHLLGCHLYRITLQPLTHPR